MDITSGKFVFLASEAYSHREWQGHPTGAGRLLIGNGAGCADPGQYGGNDLKLDEGVGTAARKGPPRVCRWVWDNLPCGSTD